MCKILIKFRGDQEMKKCCCRGNRADVEVSLPVTSNTMSNVMSAIIKRI